jgi:hypothetical protein
MQTWLGRDKPFCIMSGHRQYRKPRSGSEHAGKTCTVAFSVDIAAFDEQSCTRGTATCDEVPVTCLSTPFARRGDAAY